MISSPGALQVSLSHASDSNIEVSYCGNETCGQLSVSAE